MPTLFRRKTTTDLVETAVEETSESTEARRGYTPSKREQGLVTPKRTGNARRVIAPADRKAATAQNRASRRQQRLDEREAMMRGEEHALLPRDRGPEKRLVRNIVDARRNASSYFLLGLVLVLFLSMIQTPSMILITYGFLLFMMLTVILDGFVLARRIKSVVSAKMPKSQPRWRSLYWYGIMRSTQMRRMRVPRPQVNIGDAI